MVLCIIQDNNGKFISRDYGAMDDITDASLFTEAEAADYLNHSDEEYFDDSIFDSKDDFIKYINYWTNCKIIKYELKEIK